MPFVVQCPYCKVRARVPDRAMGASGKCSRCAGSFTLVPAEDQPQQAAEEPDSEHEPAGTMSVAEAITESNAVVEAAIRKAALQSAAELDEPEEDTDAEAIVPRLAAQASLPAWVNGWGFAALLLGGLAVLTAPLLTVRWFIIALAGLGMLSVGVGIARPAKRRRPKDMAWLAAGGLFSLVVLSVTLIAPGMLNRYWAMDGAVPRPDPHKLVANAKQGGRVLTPEDAVDAATEAIGQDGVLVRVLSVSSGPIEEKGKQSFLLIHLRLASSGQERGITFEGFGDKHRPLLKGGSGKEYPFLEQRARKTPAGGLVFVTEAARTVEIRAMKFLDYQLVFETPDDLLFPVYLELPTSAWNRKGVYRFRISNRFEPSLPEAIQKKD